MTLATGPRDRRAEGSRTIIEVSHVFKSFTSPDGSPLPVLEDITLNLYEGEIMALLGRSGSGKSTLLRCIAGLIEPSQGEISYRGEVLNGACHGVSMVFQSFALLPWLTVRQNVELGLEARGVAPGGAARTGRARHRHDRPRRLRIRLPQGAVGRDAPAGRLRAGPGGRA